VKLPTHALSHLLHAHLASQLLGVCVVTLPPSILQLAVQAYREQARTAAVSNGQREVGESLRRLGIPHELECITAGGLFSIDLAIVDRRIALEYHGPSHLSTNTLEPLGETHLRARLLSAMGWHIVSIPFFEWSQLHHNDDRDAYVEHQLKTPAAVAPATRASTET
jgi:hypothetical protein